jgi:hypothetical protein
VDILEVIDLTMRALHFYPDNATLRPPIALMRRDNPANGTVMHVEVVGDHLSQRVTARDIGPRCRGSAWLIQERGLTGRWARGISARSPGLYTSLVKGEGIS